MVKRGDDGYMKNRSCIVSGCCRNARVRDMCLSHYQSLYFHSEVVEGERLFLNCLVVVE